MMDMNQTPEQGSNLSLVDFYEQYYVIQTPEGPVKPKLQLYQRILLEDWEKMVKRDLPTK